MPHAKVYPCPFCRVVLETNRPARAHIFAHHTRVLVAGLKRHGVLQPVSGKTLKGK